MRQYQIAVLPGDGIGPEVITESVQTLEALADLHGGFSLDTQHFNWGTERYLREGALMVSCLVLWVTRGSRIT